MSGRRGDVTKVERIPEGVEVTVDLGGGDLVTAEHYGDPGVDAPPLPGDEVVVEELDGAGAASATAYQDPKNPGVAIPGEHRTYARDAAGVIVAEIWAKADGWVAVKTIKSGAKIDLNGVQIDEQGNMTVPGEITAMAAVPATAVKLSTHIHPTGVGPSGPPQPGS